MHSTKNFQNNTPTILVNKMPDLFRLVCLFTASLISITSNAGTSDPGGVAGLLFIGVIIAGLLLLIAFGLSLAVTYYMFTGRIRTLAILIVIGLWTWAFEVNIALPYRQNSVRWDVEKTTQENFSLSRKMCETELSNLNMKNFEESFATDGVFDKAASMRKRYILQLLSERKLNFVEVQVQPFGKGARIGYADGDHEPVWFVERPIGTIVRIELGRMGDDLCLPDSQLPYGVIREIHQPPFKPDTCLKFTYPLAASSRLAVIHSPSQELKKNSISYWQLIDNVEKKVLVQLPTIDSADSASAVGGLSKLGQRKVADCRSTHSILIDRLVGVEQRNEMHPQLLTMPLSEASAK